MSIKEEDGNKTIFRLCTYNIAGSASKVGDTIYDMEVDVIVLQEVHEQVVPVLSEDVELPYCLFGAGHESYGNAILSRWPIQNETTIVYRSPQSVIGRAITKVDIVHPDRVITLSVTHLNHKREDVRMEQILSFEQIMLDSDIVAGDFNAITSTEYDREKIEQKIPKSHHGGEVVAYIQSKGFVDTWKEYGVGQPFSFSTVEPFMRIDYIFCSSSFLQQITPLRCAHFPSNSSDHFPVLFDFELGS